MNASFKNVDGRVCLVMCLSDAVYCAFRKNKWYIHGLSSIAVRDKNHTKISNECVIKKL